MTLDRDNARALIAEAKTRVDFEDHPDEWLDLIARLADALKAALSAVPVEGPAYVGVMPPSPESARRIWTMYCRVCGVEEFMADSPDDAALLAHRDKHNAEVHPAVPVEGDREALNVEREKAAAEQYPDIEADPPGTATEDARFPTGRSRESEREAFVTGAEWAAGFSRFPLPVEGEVEWEYAHEYTDEGGGKHPRKVSASEYAERKPDGHRADGSPYWNYTQKRRRKAGPWEVAP